MWNSKHIGAKQHINEVISKSDRTPLLHKKDAVKDHISDLYSENPTKLSDLVRSHFNGLPKPTNGPIFVKPTLQFGYWSADDTDTNSRVDGNKYWIGFTAKDSSAIVFPVKEGKNLILKAGQTITIESSSKINIEGGSHRAHAYAPVDGTEFIFGTNWGNVEMVGNAKVVDIIDRVDARHLTYTATEDCYINFEFSPWDGTDIKDVIDTIYDTTGDYWISIKIE